MDNIVLPYMNLTPELGLYLPREIAIDVTERVSEAPTSIIYLKKMANEKSMLGSIFIPGNDPRQFSDFSMSDSPESNVQNFAHYFRNHSTTLSGNPICALYCPPRGDPDAGEEELLERAVREHNDSNSQISYDNPFTLELQKLE
ncbi:MAG: hypothetical protein ACI83O_000888 [Patescibacteria group bacterium]|jgi:hypothetical protein